MVSMATLRPFQLLVTPIRIWAQKIPWANAASWNLQYRFGLWDYLDAETAGSELFKALQKYTEQPRILDLGCGKGANLPLVPGSYRSYHGVDISAEAVNRARSLNRPNASYESADILHYEPRESYDAILLIEVIYYLPTSDIAQFLRRLSASLAPGGVMMVLIWDGLDNFREITTAIYDSGLVKNTEKIAPADDNPRTLYILA
jgi:trans-aconitate methyltransferase